MPRLALSSKAMVFVLLVFVALFATEASAKYIKAKFSEFEHQLPLSCPDTCDIWCDNCLWPELTRDSFMKDENGYTVLKTDNGTDTDTLPDEEFSATTTLPAPTNTNKPQTGGPLELGDEDSVAQPDPHGGLPAPISTNKPQTGGPLELGDEDSVAPPNPNVPLIGADGQIFQPEEDNGGGDEESTPIVSPGKIKRSGLTLRGDHNDIIKGDVSRPETWGAGPSDWWNKMNGIIDNENIRGLRLDHRTRSSALINYFDTDEVDKPQTLADGSRAGGVPALRGSTLFVAVSNLGIYTAHFWESPNFVATKHDNTTGSLNWASERQKSSWDYNIADFLYNGTTFFPSEVNQWNPWVPYSPSLRDLIRPGMILDEKSTEWREFRLFQPRDPHRGPPGTVAKNEKKMNELRTLLAKVLQVKEEKIVRHDPFYEPNSPVDGLEGSHKPTAWHNTFTWQYGAPPNKRFDRDREFRATFNGELIVDMSRTWSNNRLLDGNMCRITVNQVVTQIYKQKRMGLSVRVYSPGDTLEYKGDLSLPRQWEGDDDSDKRIRIVNKGGAVLDENIEFWYTRGTDLEASPNGVAPPYGDWHFEFQYGDKQTFSFYEDDNTAHCRAGAYELRVLHPRPVFDRRATCYFKCGAKREVPNPTETPSP